MYQLFLNELSAIVIIIQPVPVYESPCITCVQCIGRYDKYIEGCSLHWEEINSALGFIECTGRYQQWGVQFTGGYEHGVFSSLQRGYHQYLGDAPQQY